MGYKKDYITELNRLFYKRTLWLREIVGIRRQGRPKKFNRRVVLKSIRKLNDIITHLNAGRYFRDVIYDRSDRPINYHIRGRGWEDQKYNFMRWFDNRINHRNVIYIFWKDRKNCLYVGRTGRGGTRPSNHFGTYKTYGVKRVTIYKINGGRYLPMVECLAIHLFKPKHNRNKPTVPKWSQKCPVHEDHRDVREEIKAIFRIK